MSAWLIVTHVLAVVIGMAWMDHLNDRVKRLEGEQYDPEARP